MNFKRETLDIKGSRVESILIQTNEQNSLTRSSLLEFRAIMEELKNDNSVKAVILGSENEKFFSNGVDASQVAKTPKEDLAEEMGEIVKFFSYLMQFYKPLVAEIGGYAMGGGAVLALACDFRHMLNQKGRLSFTEVFFGLPLPGIFIEKIKLSVSPAFINDMIYGGIYKADEAKQIGFIHEISTTKEELRKITVKKLETITRIPISAFMKTKLSLHHDIVKSIDFHAKILSENFSNVTIQANLMEAMTAFTEQRRPKFI
ncbi:enoyl-CoA hydratase [Leptospira perolatii]|uniref:Enoyl-CoA hydratase n=1 Tax=Leptospira perolatii TaxID=2023191 RepID=A0A2M9ZS09_9LEPT|nr:enoyl-CoA hydratase/isomerase family protein [Leptospira perolatii]PJZ71336.1 enoyl-CoA hydratase [Leptospira perolatii]PJZ74870.1 enoyl-CoA hydratase [Leptospira perolatii]